MMNTKMVGIVAAAFMAGAFLASPELRAYASTIANDVICNGCVGTSDLAGNAVTSAKIKDAEVKTADIANGAVNSAKITDNSITAADIATDAVGAAELQGVTKLLFGQCVPTDFQKTFAVGLGSGFDINCNINGVDSDDSASATLNDSSHCYRVAKADPGVGKVNVAVRNDCNELAALGSNTSIAVIVFDK